jgi:hypothetical protein
MDIEISGKIVATVDSFNKEKGAPSGHIFQVMTDERGGFTMRICSHQDAPDPNPAACGVLLFPGDATLDADAIVHQSGPKPLVTLRAADFNAQR